MGTRVLDWNGLLRVADRPPGADRAVSVAGLPARVKNTRANDVGFYVHTADDEVPTSHAWALKSVDEIELLRQLVDRGLVAAADDEDPWRLDEWHRRHRFEANPRCFVAACTSPEVDQRGPVYDLDGRMHLACPRHGEAIYTVLGAQHAEDADTVEIKTFGSEEPIRVSCASCGAGPDTAHDADTHTRAAFIQARDREV